MGGSFACPECGVGIAVTGLTPGREVICPACETLVEVPYLPRATSRGKRWDRRPEPLSRRGRSTLRRQRQIRWGLALGAVLAVVAATWWAVGSIGSKARSDRERVLAELLAASDAAQAANNPGAAFREIEAAVIQARKIDPTGSTRLDALLKRRNQAARAEVEARLAALDNLGADQGVGEAKTLVKRTRQDPALAALGDAAAARLERAIARQASASRDQARSALRAGRALEAFQAASRAHDQAGQLTSPPLGDQIQAEARSLIVEAVERFGVTTTTAAVNDDPKAGSTDNPAAQLWTDTLTARGYLLTPASCPWAEVWTAHAPYQATLRVVESHNELYLQSQNRATQIDAQFSLSQQGRTLWQTRVYAQTRSPIPDLPAYVAGRLATATRRDPEAERRLRDDARTAFLLQAGRNLRGIPQPATAPAPSSTAPRPS